MAYTTIDKSSDYFNTVLYSGSASTLSVTGVGFQPDWIWIKRRNATANHKLTDSIMGAGLALSITASAEVSQTGIASFDSDGFTLGTGSADHNTSGGTYASWNWLGSNTTASNTNGSITSTVSVNTTAGFSIVSWTGSGADATIGHGLSQAPTIFILKNRSDSFDWRIGQVLTSSNNMTDGNGYYMELNSTKASTNPGSATTWGATPTAPTSSVFTVGSANAHNASGDNMVAYCFHSVKGYSKMGTYTGNGSTNGTFVYTGFKPAFVIIKRTSGTSNWTLWDTTRQENEINKPLWADLTNAEAAQTTVKLDLLSNGFKIRGTGTNVGLSGSTYIYMAFAENPFVTGAVKLPSTAR